MAKEMIVEKSILVERPVNKVYEYLQYTRNQENFSVWNMADPNKKTTSEGTDGTVGFIYSWDSQDKNVGAGSQEILKMVKDQRIDYALKFERPMKNVASSSFILEPVGEGKTKVTWDFRGPTKFPMSLFSWIFKRMLGKSLAQSLDNLKSLLEK